MTTARDMHIQARARASGLTQQQVAEVIRN